MNQNKINVEAEGICNIPPELRNKFGIYMLIVSNKYYIGSAVNLYQRLHTHKSELLKNKHSNQHLQRVFNKYQSFNFTILKILDNKDNLIKEEQYYLDTLKPELNIRKLAHNNYGLKMSEECRQKHSLRAKEWHKTIGFSEETKQKIGIGNSKHTRSEEQKSNLRLKMSGRKHSDETKLLCREKAIFSRANSKNYNFKGERNPQSKLKDHQVIEILNLLKIGKTGASLAKLYNVSVHCISLIKNNKSYKHLDRNEI